MGPPVENLGDTLERLLPSRVPNLQLKCDVLYLHQYRAELYPHSDFMVVCELVVAHPMHEAGLPDARIAYHYQLEQ